MRKLFITLFSLIICSTSNAGTAQVVNGRILQSYNTGATSYNTATGGTNIAWSVTESDTYAIMQSNFVLSNFTINISAAPTAGKSVTYTIRKNQAATLASCTVSDASTSCSYSATTIQFVPGDTIDLEAVPSGTPTAGVTTFSYIRNISKANTILFGGASSDNPNNGGTIEYSSILGWVPWDNGTAETSNKVIIMPFGGTFDNLKVINDSAPGNLKSYTYTMRLNSADTAITCQIIGASTTTSSDTAHSFSFVAGDRVNIKTVSSGTPTASKSHVGIQCHPANDGEFGVFMTTGSSPSTSSSNYKPLSFFGSATSWGSAENSSQWETFTNGFTAKAIYAYATTAPGAAASAKQYTVTLRDNQADTAYNPIIFEDGQTANEITDVTITANDNLDIQSTPSGTPATTQLHVGLCAYRTYSTKTRMS